jgi:hypothetical protein
VSESVQSEIEKIRLSIEALQAQRSLLGDSVVEPALAAQRAQLKALSSSAPLPGMCTTSAAP